MERAKQYMEGLQKIVLGGFIAPSNDKYVFDKLGNSSMGLTEKLELCNLAVRNSDWITVCGWGEYSSNKIKWHIQELIEKQFKDILGSNSVTGIESMRSDTVVGLFDIILQKEKII